MLTATVEPDRASSALPDGPLPMRGAILGALVNAFRLGDKVRAQPAGLSAGTAKRILQDEPAVASEKRTALTRALVGNLFTLDYLRDRGLEDAEAHIHDETLVAALEGVLDRWEQIARWWNHVTQPELTIEMLLLLSGLDVEVIARLAAYLCAYPRLHPVIGSLEAWLSKPGLSGAFDELMARSGQKISLERLGKDAGLQKNTLKGLRDGRVDEPQGETLEQLAHALAKHGVARRDRSGNATAAEIELELRVAAALGRAREALQNDARRAALGFYLMLLHHLRSELRRYTREQLATLVVRGSASELWPAIESLVQGHAYTQTMQSAMAIAANARQTELLFQKDPIAAMRKIRDEMAMHVAQLRATKPLLGLEDEDCEDPVFDMLDDMAGMMHVLAATAEGKADEATAYRLKTNSEALEAHGFVMNAVAPWNGHGPAERERLLREAVAAHPASLRARLLLAEELASQGRDDEALAHDYALVGEHPDNAHARYCLALRLACMDRYGESLAQLEELGRRGGCTADAEALRGRCLLEIGRVEEAAATFERVLEENDRLLMALRGLAQCRRLAGDERKARDLERRARYYGETGG